MISGFHFCMEEILPMKHTLIIILLMGAGNTGMNLKNNIAGTANIRIRFMPRMNLEPITCPFDKSIFKIKYNNMKLRHFFLLAVLSMTSYISLANNVTVTNLTITGQNNALQFKLIQFDISWDNAWKVNSGPNNWDAAWVFVKYKRKSDNTWHHATLHYADGTGSGDGHTEPAGSNISSSNDTGSGGAHGVFIHRTDIAHGTVIFTGVQLRWDYGVDDLGDGDNVELSVIAIEMVYVPQGSFYAGNSGTESGAFYKYPTITAPYQILNEDAISVGTTDGNLYYLFGSGDQLGPIGFAFPKGYSDFYCMKYEITQSQYVAFLNTLTYNQQFTRTAFPPNSPPGTPAMTTSGLYRNGIDVMTSGIAGSTPAVYACNLDNDGTYDEADDGQSIASNWFSWADVAAYLDWAALRPMTELEYEKAGRGNQAPVANEYAWGNTSVTGATSISDSGFNNETAQVGANCVYNDAGSVQGPMRSGNFAQASTTRSQAGASYYGVMDLSGNLWEILVSVGSPAGRAFTGLMGNGMIDDTGNADATLWPAKNAIGIGFRGGTWNNLDLYLRLSDRSFATYSHDVRAYVYGGRGCRQSP